MGSTGVVIMSVVMNITTLAPSPRARLGCNEDGEEEENGGGWEEGRG